MSHYAVAVFHREDQDIDELLAPYSENIEVEPYIYFTYKQAVEYAREHYANAKSKTERECWQLVADEFGNHTDEQFNILSTYNPKSKWDWYCIGGRFYDILLSKDGDEAVELPVSEIDFSPNKTDYENALEFWDKSVEGNDPGMFSIYKPEYYKQRYGDRETYAKAMAAFTTFAVVTPDGEWHEQGQMGWFGMSDETDEQAREWNDKYKEKFIDTADPSWILTIVDCHI